MRNEVGFALNGIKETAYWFRESKDDLDTLDEELGFEVASRLNANAVDKVVDVTITVTITRTQQEADVKKPPLLNYEAVFQFKVEGVDFTPQPDEEPGYEAIVLPEDLLPALIGTTYSTCRGILFARTAGSQLRNYLLPIANPISLAKGLDNKLRKKIKSKQEETPAETPPSETTKPTQSSKRRK